MIKLPYYYKKGSCVDKQSRKCEKTGIVPYCIDCKFNFYKNL